MKQKRAGKALPTPPAPALQTLPGASTDKTTRMGSLARFLLDSPLRGATLDLMRQRDEPRDVKDFAPFDMPWRSHRKAEGPG